MPSDLKKDVIRYYANIRVNYNAGLISLGKKRLFELVEFQKAISILGITSKEFLSYSD